MTTISEAANHTRRMSQDEFDSLCASIREHGQLVPILRCRGAIIDGRHRAEACRALGIEPAFADADIPEEALLAAALSANHIRKQDSSAVRALDAARLTDLESEQGHPPAPGKLSVRAACQACRVSKAQIHRARLVLQYDTDGAMQAVIRAGFAKLPQDETDFDEIESIVRKAAPTVPIGTVTENPAIASNLKEREVRKQKKAALERQEANDSEAAKAIAQRDARIALLETEVAALKADSPESAILELAQPKVIIQQDTTSKRRADAAEQQLKETKAALERAQHDVLQHQKRSGEMLAENLALKGQLAKVENATEAFSIFGRHVLTWRSDSRLILSTLKKHPRIIDLEIEKVCKEVGGNLLKVADQLADNRAQPVTRPALVALN